MMQYLFQAMNFRGPAGKPYRDLIQGVGTEEISHVELIGTTIARLMDGSPRYQGKTTDPLDAAGAGGATPLESALSAGNIHSYLVAAQGARPVDAAGNPWSGSYVYNSGNLVLDLLYNLMLESTGRLQKCRIYEMTANKTARSTLAYLIVRDQAHENAYAKALETLGIDWAKTLPIPKTNAQKFPEVAKLLELGLQSKQYSFSLDNLSEAGRIFQGVSPSGDGTVLTASEQTPRRAHDHRDRADGRVLTRPGHRPAGPAASDGGDGDGRGADVVRCGVARRRCARPGQRRHRTTRQDQKRGQLTATHSEPSCPRSPRVLRRSGGATPAPGKRGRRIRHHGTP